MGDACVVIVGCSVNGLLLEAREENLTSTFGLNFSLAFQRAEERRNPSSYAKVMAVLPDSARSAIYIFAQTK